MSRATRRRAQHQFDQALRKLIGEDGDNCSLCRARFTVNSRTFAGVGAGRVLITGECCKDKLDLIVSLGLYTNRAWDKAGSGAVYTAEQAEAMVDVSIKLFKLADTAAQMTGTGVRASLESLRERPWKADDRQWFLAHPSRAHRVRQTLPGETAPTAQGHVLPLPEQCCVIVRQIEPGSRLRLPVATSKPELFPDDEAFLHAYFDRLVARKGRVGVSDPDVTALMQDHAAAERRRPS